MTRAPTQAQIELLADLPDPPSDGLFLKAPRSRTADNCVAKGWARVVGRGFFNGASYVRTPAGRAALFHSTDPTRDCSDCRGFTDSDCPTCRRSKRAGVLVDAAGRAALEGADQ